MVSRRSFFAKALGTAVAVPVVALDIKPIPTPSEAEREFRAIQVAYADLVETMSKPIALRFTINGREMAERAMTLTPPPIGFYAGTSR